MDRMLKIAVTAEDCELRTRSTGLERPRHTIQAARGRDPHRRGRRLEIVNYNHPLTVHGLGPSFVLRRALTTEDCELRRCATDLKRSTVIK